MSIDQSESGLVWCLENFAIDKNSPNKLLIFSGKKNRNQFSTKTIGSAFEEREENSQIVQVETHN